ncbi:ArsR/SmtB family transcription factor [Williamsia muralis]|uniref:Metalloregulator ArsR/SmtB family transcription factor n=1 Tax=Williamsia marianensis TaxID=85044 RepID=A0ABU4EUX2_WILMA|nr:metalloregulator ArsR/SmtB family transcription factor [Williamsia muralis]MDV7134526.1 metalloregulator ArsR/SmtB family transcription factor [Williamsia muralis]
MSVFEAIADPVRRSILLTLVDGPTRVVDLCSNLSDAHPISRPAVSRHLRVLTDARLVIAEDRGRERHYRLDARPMDEVRRFIDELTPTGEIQPSPSAGERRLPVPESALDALDTEVRRTVKQRPRSSRQPTTATNDQETA